MKTMQVGELKTKFSEVIEQVRNGEKIVISYGKRKENVAVIVPFGEFKKTNAIKLGLLSGKAEYKFKKGYEMTEDELLNS
jgi:prevent-host-death family protein